MKSSSFKLRILSYVSAVALLVANTPLALAAEEEEAAGDPVWVLSYAGFLLFAAVTVFLCVFFSRRRETALDAAELKKVGQIRNARIKERRKAEQYARVHGQKKYRFFLLASEKPIFRRDRFVVLKMPEQNNASNPKSELFGTALGFAAFLIWGLFPLYFVLLKDVPPLVTLAFRAVFTTVVLFPIVFLRGKGRQILRTLRKPWLVAGLFVTMATTAASWGLFIWLVAVNHTLYASLGNYASPLVSVAFGALVFRERPSVLAWISITLAAIAVVVFAAGVGRLPWESVVVAFVFAIYSVLRKKMGVDSTTALSVETLFAFPIGAAYIVYKIRAPETAPFWATDAYFLWLLIGAGALTAIPLLLFGSAAVRIKLSTLGLLNYLCPTGQFLCGVFVLGEKTSAFQWVSFVLIWIALTFFTVDLFRNEKLARQPIQHANA